MVQGQGNKPEKNFQKSIFNLSRAESEKKIEEVRKNEKERLKEGLTNQQNSILSQQILYLQQRTHGKTEETL